PSAITAPSIPNLPATSTAGPEAGDGWSPTAQTLSKSARYFAPTSGSRRARISFARASAGRAQTINQFRWRSEWEVTDGRNDRRPRKWRNFQDRSQTHVLVHRPPVL